MIRGRRGKVHGRCGQSCCSPCVPGHRGALPRAGFSGQRALASSLGSTTCKLCNCGRGTFCLLTCGMAM